MVDIMAIMIPESISALESVTSGEKKVFKILKDLLPENNIIWFDLRVNRRYPDFIILSPKLGIVVLEIKDWEIKSIESADINEFKLKTLGNCVNPIKQARTYMFNIINELKKDKKLINNDGKYKGNLNFTYGHGVIFTKITRNQFNFEGVLDEKSVIFQDELNLIEKNQDKDMLTSKLQDMIPIKFDFDELKLNTIDRIRGNLFKEVKLSKDNDEIFKVMNLEQEKYAKGLGYGHRVIRGVAGSGKTVVLICRARYLKEVHKDWNILVLCYNKTLAAFLRKSINGDEKDSKVDVIHIHGLINKISKEFGMKTAIYDNQVTENISKITDEMLQKLNKYDAILIDEGQDLEAEWLQFIVKNLRDREYSHLLLASDGAQNLYSRKYTLKSVGIKAVGRTVIMRENYRNTKEILKLGNDLLLDHEVNNNNEDENEFIIEANSVLRSGQIPNVIEANSFDEEVGNIIKGIKDFKDKGLEYGEIAILYPYGKYKGLEYVKIIKEKLKEASIDYDILNKDYNKYEFKYDKDRVKISTIYSAKGLDFKAVFICGINDGLMKRKEESKKLLYVGITRARDILNVTYSVKNELTDVMMKSYKAMIEDKSNEISKSIPSKEIEKETNENNINSKDIETSQNQDAQTVEESPEKKGFLSKFFGGIFK
ncbi:DNA helicase II [Clostridium novyi A str. 4552]|uniref:DNA helicase II n=1 Tax=Clostridium novyi A str. 4552 TaxID=1444289 RepID=A0A0A0ICQ8_CLONO|nr:DNA helicase II [Clostridium novyi A str. 4552]